MAGNAEYRYWAFISYSHQDKAWGDWLHRRLETYRVPKRLVGKPHWSGTIPRRLIPIFRDRDELPSSADLGGVLNEALRRSRCQIVICSPRAARSRWVNEEIKHFKSLGREGRLLAFIVDGEPRVASERECFPPALRFKADAAGQLTNERTEIVAADARKGSDGRDGAFLKLVSGLLGVSFDDLKQRERQRQFWRRVQYAAVGVVTFAAAFGSWRWFEHYKERQALEAHVEKVYDLGRRELLDHHEARAAVYLNEAYRLGRDTPALRFMLGQAMQAVDARTHLQMNAGGAVQRSAFSGDGKRFVTAAEAGSGTGHFVGAVWDTDTGKKLAMLEDLPFQALLTRFYPDGRRVLISGIPTLREADAISGIWHSDTGQKLASVDGHTGRFGQPIDSGGRLLVTADHSTLKGAARIWDAVTFQPRHDLRCGGPVHSVSIDSTGMLVATGDEEGRVCLWSSASGRLLARLPGKTMDAIYGVLFTPDGARVLAFSAKGDVRVWDVQRRELALAFAADPYYVYDARTDHDGRRLVTIGSAGYKVWDLARGSLLASRASNVTIAATADISADGSTMVIADGQANAAELIHLPNGHTLATLNPGAGSAGGAAIRPDGRQLLLANQSGEISLWALPLKKMLEIHHSKAVFAARRSPTGERLMTAGYDGSLMLWDDNTGAPVARVAESSRPMMDARYSPDGKRIATISDDGAIILRDSTSLARLMSESVKSGNDYDLVSFSSDSSVLGAAAGRFAEGAASTFVWSAADGHLRFQLDHGCAVRQVRFLPAGDAAVTGCSDGKLRLWNLKSGQLEHAFDAAADPAGSFSISPHGKFLAAFSPAARKIWAWNIADREQLPELPEEAGHVPVAIAFDEDERRMAISRLDDNRISIYGLDSGTHRLLAASPAMVEGLQFLQSGLLVSFRGDDSVRVWDADRGEVLAEVASHDGRALNIEIDERRGELLTAGQDGAAIRWNIRSEDRAPAKLAEILVCGAPWRIEGESLLPVAASGPGCNR